MHCPPCVSQSCGQHCLGQVNVLVRGSEHVNDTLQILAVSSAATAFKLVSDVPAVTLAAWRLQLTGVLLLPGAIIQYRKLSSGQHFLASHC